MKKVFSSFHGRVLLEFGELGWKSIFQVLGACPLELVELGWEKHFSGFGGVPW